MKRSGLVLVLVLALAAGAGGFLASTAMRSPPAAAGAAAMLPPFSLTDIDGTVRQSSEWDGRPRIINFWATWCPPCRREIPLLIDVQAQHAGALQVIGVAIDDMAEVQDYAADTGFNYPVLVGQQDAVNLGNQVLEDWIGLPFTAFVDASGKITRVHVGELHADQAETFIAEML